MQIKGQLYTIQHFPSRPDSVGKLILHTGLGKYFFQEEHTAIPVVPSIIFTIRSAPAL